VETKGRRPEVSKVLILEGLLFKLPKLGIRFKFFAKKEVIPRGILGWPG